MGIKYLNRFLLDNCTTNAIRKVSLSQFSGKVVVIDTSIYLYKFVGENALLENIYLMISIFRHYNIIPVFIFDGKPPMEKKELLQQRKLKKNEAEKYYNELKNKIDTNEVTSDEIQDIEEKMDLLKRQFVRIRDIDILNTKKLLKAYGVQYFEAEGEADVLCCQLIITNKAWACVSDDMDMFVYGCRRVIRQISLMNHTCVFYDMKNILDDLNMDITTFRQIMVISGTDYNINEKNSLHETLKWYYKYQEYLLKKEDKENIICFYEWLFNNTKYIGNMELLFKVYDMFVLSDVTNIYITFNNVEFKLNEKNDNELKKILLSEGFLY
jgi:flap endonuclease-1